MSLIYSEHFPEVESNADCISVKTSIPLEEFEKPKKRKNFVKSNKKHIISRDYLYSLSLFNYIVAPYPTETSSHPFWCCTLPTTRFRGLRYEHFMVAKQRVSKLLLSTKKDQSGKRCRQSVPDPSLYINIVSSSKYLFNIDQSQFKNLSVIWD